MSGNTERLTNNGWHVCFFFFALSVWSYFCLHFIFFLSPPSLKEELFPEADYFQANYQQIMGDLGLHLPLDLLVLARLYRYPRGVNS